MKETSVKTGSEAPPSRIAQILRILGVAALLAAMVNVGLAFRSAWVVKERVDQAEQDLARARERNERLRRQIHALQTSPQAAATTLRIWNESKPGEEVIPPR